MKKRYPYSCSGYASRHVRRPVRRSRKDFPMLLTVGLIALAALVILAVLVIGPAWKG